MPGLSADREQAQISAGSERSVVLRALSSLAGLFSGVTHGVGRFVNFGLLTGLLLGAGAIASALVRFMLDVLTLLGQTQHYLWS
jgi:hypothetical protein